MSPKKITSRKKTSKSPARRGKNDGRIGLEWVLYLCLAWGLILAGLLSLVNYNWLLPEGNPFAQLPTKVFLWAGFLGLVFLWRMVPEVPEDNWDLKPWVGRGLFWAFMALGAFLRLDHPNQPVGGFWDDHYIVTSDIRNILDYNEHPLLFPSGWREPLFPYLTAFLWALVPGANGVFIVHLSSAVVDLVTLWLFYLLGKEIGGRRMGLVLLAMGAICKAYISTCIFGYGIDTTVFGCALVFLFFLRLLKKPDLKHFLEWGAALGVAGYVYAPYRPWTPVMLGIVWLWVFSDPKERKFDPFRIALASILGFWAFIFVYVNAFLPQENPLVKFIAGPIGVSLIVGGVLFSLFKTMEKERRKGFSKLTGWACAALLTALMMVPLFLHPHYSSHTSDISVFSKYYAQTPADGWRQLRENINFSVGLMYGYVIDVAQCPMKGDCVFDFWAAACGLLGLSYFVARPRWVPAFVVLLYGVSMVPFILSHAPHSFRLMAVYLPLFLTAAWGVNRLWVAVLQAGNRPLGNALFGLFLLLFCAWEVDRNRMILKAWLAHLEPNALVADQAAKELPDHRVYLANHLPGFYTCGQDILCDGKDIFQMGDSNSIDLLPDEKAKDLAILVYVKDPDNQKKIEAAFPGLEWKKRKIFWQEPSEDPFLWWVEVPADRVPVSDKGLFHIRRVSPWSWQRRCYGRYGLGRGLILYEDRVTLWNDNLPPANVIDWNNSMRVEGNWSVKTGGNYGIGIRTANVLWVFLDGKKILEVKPRQGLVNDTVHVDLKPGSHHVELVTAFTSEHRVPTVYVTPPGGAETPLDAYAAQTAQP